MHSDIKGKFSLRIYSETLQKTEMKGERKRKSNTRKLTKENSEGKSNAVQNLKSEWLMNTCLVLELGL